MKIRMHKLLASVVAIAMLFTLVPMTVFAQAGAVTVINFAGANRIAGVQTVSLYTEGQGVDIPLATAATTRTEVTITPEQASTEASTLLTTTGGTPIIRLIRQAGASGLTGTTTWAEAVVLGDAWAAVDLDAAPLATGDLILIADGAPADPPADGQFLVIEVTVQAGGATLPPSNGTDPTAPIEGRSVVEDVVFNVVVPTQLDFGIDPFGQGDVVAGSQISMNDFRMVNRTQGLPVLVSFDIEAIAADGVSLVASADALTNARSVNGNAPATAAHFGVLGASAITAPVPTYLDSTLGTMTFNPIAPGTLSYFDAAAAANVTESTLTAEFLLGAATADPDALASNNQGVSSFTFIGTLNTYADWSDDDITIGGAYTLYGIIVADYSYYAAQTTGLNIFYLENAAEIPPTLTVTASGTHTVATWTQQEPLTILFDVDPIPPSVTVATTANWPANRPTGGLGPDWRYDETTGLLTIFRSFGSVPNTLNVTAGTGADAVELRLNVTAR